MSLKKINQSSVHKICSGQVVLSLAVAVKELVENSLDAGATSIEVRLKDHGADLLEVIDNGSGVEPENFQALTLKHFTSKISDFTDVATVETFGFRGEALSSLCALSDLVVVTCHRDQTVASRIEYDNNGKIKAISNSARETGTTVSLSNLFHTLPVRQKEFHRNIKKEFGRMIHMLQGYCLVSENVRITCYNQIGKNKKQLILSTVGSSKMADNISCVFGPKQLHQLVEIVQSSVKSSVGCPERESPLAQVESPVPPATSYDMFKFSGFISKCTHGFGRSTTDRQFFFFNGRPCDHSKLAKTVNEVYHMYNRHQYPFVIMNITTERDHVDVNITPDKRQVMVQEEKALLLLIKESLINMFESVQGQVESSSTTPTSCSFLSTPNSTISISETVTPSSHLSASNDEISSVDRRDSSPLCGLERSFSYSQSTTASQNPLPRAKQPKLTDFGISKASLPLQKQSSSEQFKSQGRRPSSGLVLPVKPKAFKGVWSPENVNTKQTEAPPKTIDVEMETNQGEGVAIQDEKTKTTPLRLSIANVQPCVEEKKKFSEDKQLGTIEVDIGLMAARQRQLSCPGYHSNSGSNTRSARKFFHAKIDPESNQLAEKELKRELNKGSFHHMQVLGQFNLGFIITKLEDHLFIIDQHATDEKYNYERLQRDTEIEHQTLLQPLPLELTAVGESVVMENREIFLKNGFKFLFDENGPPTKRVKLVGQPVSKNWSMGVPEIEELIFLLTDYPGEMVRPACVNKMFAMRACRGSIMIGTPLNKQQMKKLLKHMGEMKQPWNCPHGRPTLRHLIDLSKLSH